MHTFARTVLAASLASAAATPLLAQASAPTRLAQASAPTAQPEVIAAVPYGKIYDPAVASARIARADELYFVRSKAAAAVREYRAVAKMQREHDVLPTEAVWKLAEASHASQRFPERTAAIFRELARDAERLGDPAVQAKALLEATVLYNSAGMKAEAHACAARLEQLMASPHVSNDLRSAVQTRIIRK